SARGHDWRADGWLTRFVGPTPGERERGRVGADLQGNHLAAARYVQHGRRVGRPAEDAAATRRHRAGCDFTADTTQRTELHQVALAVLATLEDEPLVLHQRWWHGSNIGIASVERQPIGRLPRADL